MMTAFASVGSAVEAMRAGASDYITKPFINDEIRLTIKRILQGRELQMENQILRQELSQRPAAFKNIIGSSEPMQKVFSVMEKVIPSKSNILITGESGTGKGLVAQAIHRVGPPQGQALHLHQLRRHPREPARERAFRPQEGRLHLGQRGQEGPDHHGPRRHPVPGRDRRTALFPPGEAAACDPDQGADTRRATPG